MSELFQILLEGTDKSVLALDPDLNILFWNERLREQARHSPRLVVGGHYSKLISEFGRASGCSDEESEDLFTRYVDPLKVEAGNSIFREEYTDFSGGTYRIQGVRTSDGSWVLTYTDMSESRKAAAEAVIHMTQHDSLTGLPNRTKFRRDLARSVVAARNNGHIVGVIAIDLNDFKGINAALGHEVGDALLIDVATTLRDKTGERAHVSRSAADEFVVVVPATGEDEIRAVALSLLNEVKKPRDIRGHRIRIAASVGVSVFPGDGEDPERLLRSANVALHNAQREGRDTIAYFHTSMSEEAEARSRLEHDILNGLDNDHFTLHYQPQLDLKANKLIGVEALLRWNHPERGWISPASFVAIAELSKLIIPLSEKLLGIACDQIASWDREGVDPVRVAFNLSPYHINAGGVGDLVERVLAQSGLSADRLELEITESTMATDSAHVLRTLEHLHRLGVTLAIDDFGTGYSSMSQLRQLPLDVLKIDRSFVAEMCNDSGAQAIVETVINLAHTLGLKVIAEGIETAEQLEKLRDLDCDYGQGYLFAYPMPAGDLAKWIRERPWESPAGSQPLTIAGRV